MSDRGHLPNSQPGNSGRETSTGRHRATFVTRRRTRIGRGMRWALHPAAHVLALIALHLAALTVLAAAKNLPILTNVLH
ncbi:hypothetical protein AB0J82_36710 [Asanoa sp. NPDC049518]|uniref:hypothetical protein n=1 Tax=unclassified Asanoa TaxID=2685164 RepID=UPI00341CC774